MKEGNKPSYYKKNAETYREILTKERSRDYGLDVYLLRKYMDFKDAIIKGDIVKVENVFISMYDDIPLDEITTRMCPMDPTPRDLLSLCVDEEKDVIGTYLLSHDASGDIQVGFSFPFFLFFVIY